jgi:lipoprotein-releasing system ATP-binding protein
MSDANILDVSDLKKSYTNGSKLVEVLRGVNLKVRHGETVSVSGPSGVGKSTLLHILGLLDRPSDGKLSFDGVDIDTLNDSQRSSLRNKRIGFVFQFFQLLSEFTALENVIMPGMIAGERRSKLKARAEGLLEEVGLGARINHRPGELSGGEQQRTAIARALIMEPDIILADEPTGNLDPETGQEIEDLLLKLNESRQTSLIVVTHKESLADAMKRRVGFVGGQLQELR